MIFLATEKKFLNDHFFHEGLATWWQTTFQTGVEVRQFIIAVKLMIKHKQKMRHLLKCDTSACVSQTLSLQHLKF